MAILEEIRDKISEISKPTDREYFCRLYVDKKRDTATLYVMINNRYEVRFGFTDPYKKLNQEPKYAISAILRSTDQPVADMDVELFSPVEGITDSWQINIEYPNNQDTVILLPTGKSADLVATTDVVNIEDLLAKPKAPTVFDELRTQDSEPSVRSFINNLGKGQP